MRRRVQQYFCVGLITSNQESRRLEYVVVAHKQLLEELACVTCLLHTQNGIHS